MAASDRITTYRRRAAEARQQAALADDAGTQGCLLRVAAGYERIAARKEYVERHAAMIEVERVIAPLTALLRV
ncbi:MAG: hypothetical protein FJX52_15285 [Alphaproteobacteria bacterium]|nr:hypothetical protein [Alphaproteobacteria bacterium]